MKSVSISVKPSSLNYSEILQLAAAVRYPDTSRPVLTWVARESLCIALLGGLYLTVIECFIDQRFLPGRFAMIGIPIMMLAGATYLVLSVRRSYRAYQAAEIYVIELSEEGISWRNRDTESKLRWKPSTKIVEASDFIFIHYQKELTLFIPKGSFASPEAADDFLLAGRFFHETAAGAGVDQSVGIRFE